MLRRAFQRRGARGGKAFTMRQQFVKPDGTVSAQVTAVTGILI
jgi:hypothetical protein